VAEPAHVDTEEMDSQRDSSLASEQMLLRNRPRACNGLLATRSEGDVVDTETHAIR
jgi:hypothetical protein